jgi:hypothetical protein
MAPRKRGRPKGSRNGYRQKPGNLSPSLRHATWVRTCGKIYERLCPCCSLNLINVFNFHCAHVLARKNKGPDAIHNLRAVCGPCNLSCGTQSLHDFNKELVVCGGANKLP